MNIDVPITGTNYRPGVYEDWHYNGAGYDGLELERDWFNSKDPFAIKVMYRSGLVSSLPSQYRQLGWIAATDSEKIAKRMLTHKVVPIAVVKSDPDGSPMTTRLVVRFNMDQELKCPVQPPAQLAAATPRPRHIVKVFGALTQNPQAIKELHAAPPGTIFDCGTGFNRSSISLHRREGGEVAWFRKEEPGAMLGIELVNMANRDELIARVESQNPVVIGLYKRGEIREPETLLEKLLADKADMSVALAAARENTNSITNPTPTKKESTMNNFFSRLIAVNTKAAGDAAYLETGRIANNTVIKIITARLPFMARFYAKTPFGKLATANAAIMLAQQLRPSDERLQRLTAAMTTVAYQEAIQLIDIEGMIDQLMAEPAVRRALDKMETKTGPVHVGAGSAE